MLNINNYFNSNKITASLAKRLTLARESRGVSQSSLAKTVGITQQAIQCIEAGITKRPRELEKIAQVLGVDVAWLQFGVDSQKNNQIDNSDKLGYNFVPLLTNQNLFDLTKGNKNIKDFPGTIVVMTNFIEVDADTFAYEICNNAMKCPENSEKSLIRGEIAIIKSIKTKEIEMGDLVLVKSRTDDFIVREFNKDGNTFVLEPYNSAYPVLNFDENYEIIGAVVATQRLKKKS